VKPNVGAVSFVGIITSGAVRSTIHERVAGEGSTMPPVSFARTANVAGPPAYVKLAPETQLMNVVPSFEHSNVEAGSGDANSNWTVAPVDDPAAGPVTISVSGAVVSTTQPSVAGDGSTLPARSLARTAKLRVPSLTAASCGDVHAANAAPSSAHSNVTAPAVSLPANVNSAVSALSSAGGPDSSSVSGAVMSVVHVAIAGVSSMLVLSAAATENVCGPSATSVSNGGTHSNSGPVSN